MTSILSLGTFSSSWIDTIYCAAWRNSAKRNSECNGHMWFYVRRYYRRLCHLCKFLRCLTKHIRCQDFWKKVCNLQPALTKNWVGWFIHSDQIINIFPCNKTYNEFRKGQISCVEFVIRTLQSAVSAINWCYEPWNCPIISGAVFANQKTRHIRHIRHQNRTDGKTPPCSRICVWPYIRPMRDFRHPPSRGGKTAPYGGEPRHRNASIK